MKFVLNFAAEVDAIGEITQAHSSRHPIVIYEYAGS